MEASNEKATLTEAFNKVEEVKKSIADSEVVKNETAVEDTKDEAQKSVEADHAEKSNEVENSEGTTKKHIKDMSISDDNEKATKSEKKDDEKAEKCGDGEVEESVHRSKHDQDQQDEANKSVEKSDDEADDEEDKSEKSLDPDVKTKAPKTPDKPKEISNIEDKEGHEKASKSVDVMAKSLDAVVEMHKAYQAMAESTIKSLQEENKSLRKSLEAGSVIKSANSNDDDKADKKCGSDKAEESAKNEKCDTGSDDATDEQDQQASKSVNDDKEEKHDDESADKANKSVETSDNEIEKSMPQGKAIANAEPETDEVEKSADQVKMGDLKDVVVKSISALSNTQESENLHKAGLLKSLYADIRDVDDGQAVSDDLISRYNNI